MQLIPLPDHLRGVFFDRLWDNNKIWALPTPTTLEPLADLVWLLSLTVWSTVRGEARFDLAPAMVVAQPDRYPRHWAGIGAVDLAYPLELFSQGDRWVIVDGYHRLARHWLESSEVVPVRLHPKRLWLQVAPDSISR
jgi:hypothetical protein